MALLLGAAACGDDGAAVETAGVDAGENTRAPESDTSSNDESVASAESTTTSTRSTMPSSRPTTTALAAEPMALESEGEAWHSFRDSLGGQILLESETSEGLAGPYRVVARNIDGRRAIDIAAFDGRGWRTVSTITLPPPDFPFGTGRTVQSADVTGDRQPDFLVPLDAAQTIGVVISSADGEWRALPVTGADGMAAEPYLGVNPRIEGGELLSDFRICEPSCAEGETQPVTWRYQQGSLVHAE
ncbi:MAG: hypothetical protein JJE52_05250 [Acidimicrobiia bacterium]|nr:hypothetical protein [Acidimicrobiia bacterium]